MMVENDTSSVEYQLSTSTGPFSIPFYFIENGHIVAELYTQNGDDFNKTTLTIDVDYYLNGAGDKNGGQLTLLSAHSGATLLIYRDPDATQLTSYLATGKFPATSHERALDKLTMLIQKFGWWWDSLALKKPNIFANYYDALNNRIRNLRDPSLAQDAATKSYVDSSDIDLQQQITSNFNRSLRVPDSYISQLPSAQDRAWKGLGFDGAGQPKLQDPAGTGLWGYVPAIGSFEQGSLLTQRFEVLLWESTDEYWRWDGVMPKVVLPGSTPATAGGTGKGKWVDVTDATLRSNLGSSELPGGSLVALEFGTVAGLLQGRTYPQAHGAVGNGVHDDTDALYAAFKSSAETVHIPRGTYLITRKLKCLLTKNLRVTCAPGVVFKLADNARCNMMVFVSDRKHDFEWFGGEFDGNWAGQGDETLNSNGTFKDLSHGFIVSLFNNVRLDNMYVHSFRGHSMNHAGNKKLHASNLRFNSHIAQAFPFGGSRGDGITGCSEDVLIENVYGFTTDDMVAVFAGILWVEGGTESDSEMVTNLDYLTCKSVTLRNINPWKKYSDLDGATEVYTWNAIVVGTQGGASIEKVSISDVKGYCQYSGIRPGVSQPVGSSPATDYWGSIGSLIIDNVSIRVAGAADNQHLYNTIRIGSLTAAASGTEYECVIKSATISNVQLFPSGNTRTLIGVGYTTIYNLNLNNINTLGQVADDTYNMLRCTGNRQIAQLNIDGVTHNPPTTSSDTVAQAQLALSWEVTFGVAAKIYANGLPVRRNAADTAYISNVNIVSGAVAPQIYGYDVVVRTPTNFYALPKVKGVHCRDRYLGRVRVAPSGLWEFEEFSTKYEDSTYGRPSPALMSGYSNITWEDGMSVRTYGSPYGEVEGWRYNRDGNWQMLGGYLTNNTVAMIDVSTVPSKFAPYTTVTSPIYNDASWPLSNGAVTLYTGHPNGRAGAYEVVDGGTAIYRRTWNATAGAWNPWFSISLT
ncbi:TPA: hypothetical protein ACQ7GL_000053 [Klebsiella pneumoniae]